jgi:hypothetical protein
MKNNLLAILALLMLSQGLFSCKKTFDDNTIGPVQDKLASIPVTVTNATFFERYPIVTTSVAAGGKFDITFEIPADKGTIKDISKVTTGTSIGLPNVQTLAASNAVNTAGGAGVAIVPVPGNNTNRITYSSSLAEYTTYRIRLGANAGPAGPQVGPPTAPGGPATGPVTAPVPAAATSQTPTEITYYFMITLTDNTTIIPLPVRVRVIP